MKRKAMFGKVFAAAAVALSVETLTCHATLEEGFKTPPSSAKPHTWYHMMNGNVTKEGITRDFEELAKVGIGGVQMFDAGCAIPPGGLDFNSPEWFDMFKHAASEAKRLGLEICIPNCSGWSSSGGPWNPPANGMKEVTWRKVEVTGPSKFSAKLDREKNDNGFYKDIGVFAFPRPLAEKVCFDDVKSEINKDGFTFSSEKPFEIFGFSYRLDYGWCWSGTADFEVEISDDGKTFKPFEKFAARLGLSGEGDRSLRFHALPRKTAIKALRVKMTRSSTNVTIVEVRPEARAALHDIKAKTFGWRMETVPDSFATFPEQVVQKNDVRDITEKLAADGTLTWDVPAGDWVILRIGYRCNGRRNHPASKYGCGLEVDKLSAEALDYHFEQYVARLCKTLGPLAGDVEHGFNNILVDSYEVGSQNWTQKMEEEFSKRRGYSIRPYMPVFAGYIIKDVETTERFLEDFRRAVADLFAENYAGALTKKCHEYGLKCSIEPYGNAPCDNLQYGQYCDIPMGEFWSYAGNPYGTGAGNSKFVSYVAHVWGKKYCGTESFTASPGKGSGRWLTTPFTIKSQGDTAYADGINRIIYHRFTHQPWAEDKYLPGMTMGRWGMHLDRTQTWWDFAKPWFAYQARCQYMLQQGTFCADILYFAGEEAPNQGGNSDGGAGDATFYNLPQGYDRDICPTDAMYQLKVENGLVVVPGGVKYRLLAIPPMTACSPDMLACITKLREQGATIVWTKKPVRAPGLKWGKDSDAKVRKLADALWGKGIMTCSVPEALAKLGIAPDVIIEKNDSKDAKTINWIHRSDNSADWYFTAMPNREEATAEISFRQTGRVPELWDAERGTIATADVWREENGRTYVTIPYTVCGSKFVVFRKGAAAPHNVKCDVAANRRLDPVLTDSAKHTLVIKDAQYGVKMENKRPQCADVTKIIKPGEEIRVNSQNLGCDPAVNKIKSLEIIYMLGGEKKRVEAKEYSSVKLPQNAKIVSAWYGIIDENWVAEKDRLADITAKLNGMVRNGTLSATVGNELAGCDPANMTPKKLYLVYEYDGVEKKEVVNESQTLSIPKSARQGLPTRNEEWCDGKLYAWQPLTATVTDSAGVTKTLKANPPPAIPVTGPWNVFFPAKFLPNKLAKGPKEKAVFDSLESWSDNANEGIRYFSGIATYEKTLDAVTLPSGARLILDLGNVKELAEVSVNDKTYSPLWKPPFRLDITDAIKRDKPIKLRISVANLWANRLIGDDRLFEDDCTWRGRVENGVKEIGVKEIPQWVKDGKKSPTGRCTFTTWKHWDKNDELLASGLLGPVYLRIVVPCE